MGIFAKGSQFPATVEVDTPQNRYGGQLTKDSVAGDALGETIGEVNATADSANTTTGEIIADIEALEGRVTTLENDPGPDLSGKQDTLTSASTSGTGWRANRWGRLVTVFINGATAGFTLPVEFAPAERVYVPIAYGKADPDGRVFINTTGEVQLMGASGGVYAVATYLI